MTNELKDIDTNDTVPYERNDSEMTKVKWSIETNDFDNDFLRDYKNMHKSMEDRQINDFDEARRHIQNAMMGDTPVKTVQNRQCIDNMSDYGPPCSLCGGFNHSPKHCYKGEHDINNIMEKMSINPHQQQQSNLYQ